MPAWLPGSRIERRRNEVPDDNRDPFQRDRDRILYSSAFRRLSGITQIVRTGESDVFHTRQQHTLKVAQVGRRLAEKCIADRPEANAFHEVNPDVVEAACLAHDLGHPPFGHIGEQVLDKMVKEHDSDGFEGNSQSFRILTKLAVRFERPGLDLTRATLAAVIKYPWFRDPENSKKKDKWGSYRSENDDFMFARQCFSHERKTAEAEIMDWADDVAYSVHDLEDFHRCGIIPWTQILSGAYSDSVLGRAKAAWFDPPADADARLKKAMNDLASFLNNFFSKLLTAPYEGTRDQRFGLRRMTSNLINRYIGALRLADSSSDLVAAVEIDQSLSDEIKILKQITRDYIINVPSLAAQQKGQKNIITDLYNTIYNDFKEELPNYLPKRLRYLWDEDIRSTKQRFVADCICNLTEAETVGIYNRLRGSFSGSVLDPIVR